MSRQPAEPDDRATTFITFTRQRQTRNYPSANGTSQHFRWSRSPGLSKRVLALQAICQNGGGLLLSEVSQDLRASRPPRSFEE